MSEEHGKLENPKNRVVVVFDEMHDAQSATQELVDKFKIPPDKIDLVHGSEDTDEVETSPRWFADHDIDLERYRHRLAAGATVLSIPVENQEKADKLAEVLTKYHADMMTHFGTWEVRSEDL